MHSVCNISINSRYVANVTVAIGVKTIINQKIKKKKKSHLFNTTFEVRVIREAQ